MNKNKNPYAASAQTSRHYREKMVFMQEKNGEKDQNMSLSVL